MKNFFKKALLVLAAAVIIGIIAETSPSVLASDGDPSAGYVKQVAPNEDSSIKLWFEHSFKKVLTDDKTPSGMDTYSAYMAKNEVENIQFVLYSDSTKSGLGANVTDFTDSNGNIIKAEIYYEMYITVDGILDDFVVGANSSNTPIREGEIPDPVYPLANIGGKFQLNAKKSQAFFVKLKTDMDTPSGWYSAQLNITNSQGQTVKTATVFCYVWDFELSEATEFKTAFFLNNDTTYGGTYEKFYNYLLENRLVAMDVPGGLTPDNEYLTNPRVNAIRVTYGGGGSSGSYGEVGTSVEYHKYLDVYNSLSSSDIWDDVKDKFYFYTADEPVGAVWNKLTGSKNMTVDDVETFYGHLEKYWEDPKAIVPYHENHPYPYFNYTKSLYSYSDYQLKDSTQGLIDGGGVSIWCPQIYAFTPQHELTAAGYKGMGAEPVRDLSSTISGLYTYGTNNSSSGTVGVDLFWGTEYYNWNNLYGEFSDRINSEIYLANKNGSVANSELWTYGAGGNYCYTYTNHLIENTGLQTKLFFWQCYGEEIDGYLYYSVNGWDEVDDLYGTNTFDNTTTGSFKMSEWRTNKLNYNGATFYGNGVLFYGATQAKIRGVSDYVGTLRVELMRDGIEEYQMLSMLEDYLGESAAKETVAKVSTNIVRYLSLPGFNRSAYPSSMDDYDIMNLVRKEMGNTLEAAVSSGKCEHQWDSGKTTENATCLTTGTTVYTCTKCDAEYDEVIPAKHSVGDCFTKVSGNAATCTEDGAEIYKCSICGYRKTVTTKAFHRDRNMMRFESTGDSRHLAYCTVCGDSISGEAHVFVQTDSATCSANGVIMNECRICNTKISTGIPTSAKGHELVEITVDATCTEAGYTGKTCKNCDYSETVEIPKKEHSYVDSVCEYCGESKPEDNVLPGDLNGDDKVNAMDLNIAKRILSGAATPTASQVKAGDINGDGFFNGLDSNFLSRIVTGK